MTVFNLEDVDELRAAIEHERDAQVLIARRLIAQIAQTSDDPAAHALAESFKAAAARERRYRMLLRCEAIS